MLPTIKLFTDAFNVLPYTNGKEKKRVFIMLKSQLLLIDNKLGNAFNFFAWLDSKIENRPLVEVVREREKYKVLMTS